MFILLILACQVSSGTETPTPSPAVDAPPAAATPPAPEAATPPAPETTMPPLSPSGPFMAWLASHPDPIQLPVRIEISPLGIEGAALIAEPPVPLSLDTGAMGVDLPTRLQEHCAGEEVCSVWLKGRYGPLVADALALTGHTLSVYEVTGAVGETPTQARAE